MNIIYATYNIHHDGIDVYTYAGYFLRIDCAKAEEVLKTTPCSEFSLNASAIEGPLEYTRFFLNYEYFLSANISDFVINLMFRQNWTCRCIQT